MNNEIPIARPLGDSTPSTEPLPCRHRVNWKTLELIVKGPYDYPIDLERCSTAAEFLFHLLQIAKKPWCDAACLQELVDCFDQACLTAFGRHAQSLLCPDGRPAKVNWRTGIIFKPWPKGSVITNRPLPD